jgi:NADP-dependent 3-hydroxy acid dehydrogenase YdfG
VATRAIQADRPGLATKLGGSQGIGTAVAEMLADAGADIVLNHHGATAQMARLVPRSGRQMGHRVPAVEADVACRAEVAAMVERPSTSPAGSTSSSQMPAARRRLKMTP